MKTAATTVGTSGLNGTTFNMTQPNVNNCTVVVAFPLQLVLTWSFLPRSRMKTQPVAMETSRATTMTTYQVGMTQPWELQETWLRTMRPTSMRTLSQRGSRNAPSLVLPYFLARYPSRPSPAAAMMKALRDSQRRISCGSPALIEAP